MPYKKKYNKKGKKKYNKKKGPKVYNVSKALTPFPSGMVAKIKFVDNILLDSNTGAVAYQVYRANSVYDPRQGAFGHQPRSFDEYMSIYGKFRVLGSRMKAQFINDKFAQNASNEQSVIAFAGLVNEATAVPSNMVEALESRQYSTRILGNLQSGKFHQNIVRKFSAKKHWGGAPPATEDVFEGGAAADCLKQAFYVVGSGNYDLTENPAAVHCLVEIEYIVKFYEPKLLPQS